MTYRTQEKYFAFCRSNSICSSHVIFLLIAGFRLFYAINNDDRFQIQLIFTMKCTRERFNWFFSDVAERKKTSGLKGLSMLPRISVSNDYRIDSKQYFIPVCSSLSSYFTSHWTIRKSCWTLYTINHLFRAFPADVWLSNLPKSDNHTVKSYYSRRQHSRITFFV